MLMPAFVSPNGCPFLRDKNSAGEPTDPSSLSTSVGEKSSLLAVNRAKTHPEAHSPTLNEFSICSRASLSFLSDLYFGARSSSYTTWTQTHCIEPDWQLTSLGLCLRRSPSHFSTSLSGSSPWLDQSFPASLPSPHSSSASPPSAHLLLPAVAVLYWPGLPGPSV